MVLLLVAGVSLSCSDYELPGRTAAITDVSVISVSDGQVFEGYTVVVEEDRIIEVGPASEVELPTGAVTIDGDGRYLIPGLGEMHGHLPGGDAPYELVDRTLFLYLANGVTTVRGMLGDPVQFDFRNRIVRGELAGPNLYLAGPSFNGGTVRTPEEGVERVRRQAEQHWDFLKIHPGLSRESYDAVAAAAREVGIPWVGHVPEEVGLIHALESGQETIDHLDGYVEYFFDPSEPPGTLDEARFEEAIRKSVESGVRLVPTMVLWETLLGVPSLETLQTYDGLEFWPESTVNQWASTHRTRLENQEMPMETRQAIVAGRMRLLKALQDAGVPIIFGTDSPQQFSVPGFSIHREMAVMEEAGLTPQQILYSATAAIGDYLGGDFGSVEPGRRADLVLVSGNPLEELSHLKDPAGVMVRGRWFSGEEIAERLAGLRTQ